MLEALRRTALDDDDSLDVNLYTKLCHLTLCWDGCAADMAVGKVVTATMPDMAVSSRGDLHTSGTV